jgi:hypothetical protein
MRKTRTTMRKRREYGAVHQQRERGGRCAPPMEEEGRAARPIDGGSGRAVRHRREREGGLLAEVEEGGAARDWEDERASGATVRG